MSDRSHKIISVTGTKGKTTVVYLVDEILRQLGRDTLRVDTTGHFVNGQRRSSLDDSKNTWRLVPSVCPGRYLWEFFDGELMNSQNGVAVLECSLGSSNLPGLGYKVHDIGIFTNVFEDHLGSSSRLKTQEDIASAKEFIFRRIVNDGYAIFNSDDQLVCSKLARLGMKDANSDVKAIPCGVDHKYFDLKKHLSSDGTAFSIKDAKIVMLSGKRESVVCDLEVIPWTFGGRYLPSALNLMYAAAAVCGYYKGKLPDGFRKIIESLRLDPYGGRMTVLRAANGAMVIADYAHEKVSLQTIGKLARDLARERGGETIGVVRMAYDRTDDMIRETGEVVGKAFDQVVVWDKIDGYWRQPKKLISKTFVQEVGKISKLLAAAVATTNPNVTRILREDEALEFAAKVAGPKDVVVAIVNDDVSQSVDWIKEKFDADFA